MLQSNSNEWKNFKVQWREVFAYFKSYFRNPIKSIRRLPDWNWKTLIALHLIIGSICGSLSGLISGLLLSIIVGMIFMPFTYFLTIIIFSGCFYYLFLFGLGREVNFLKIFTLLTLSGVFFMLSFILKPIISPIILIGLAMSALITIVGFVDHFALPKKIIIRIVCAMYLIFLGMWTIGAIQTSKKGGEIMIKTTPESLDILEKEMKE